VRRPLPLLAWVAIPVLFTAATLGLTSLGELLLNLPGDTVLTSAHLGAAAALTAMVGLSIEWPARWRTARWIYPFVVFAAGIALHGLDVPAIPALAAGLPSAAILARIACMHKPAQETRRSTLVSTSAS
jgi:hypothetical protein